MKLAQMVEKAQRGITDKRDIQRMQWTAGQRTNASLDARIIQLEADNAVAAQELTALWEERAYRVEYMGLSSSEETEV